MDLVFVDEQYGIGEHGEYTAALAAIFREDVISDFRDSTVRGLLKILNLPNNTDDKTILTTLPVLHGSDLLPDYDDEIKLSVLNLIVDLVAQYNIKIVRVGYYNDSIPFIYGNAGMVGFCIQNMEQYINPHISGNYIFAYELDKENLNKTFYNDIHHINSFAQMPNRELSVTIDFSRSLGKFYCSKENWCMYVSDIAGHLLKKLSDSTPRTQYTKSIVSVAKKLDNHTLLNKITYMSMKKT